jgi:peptidoglycan/LPS O-acetylase OafA/YrhL
LPESLGTTDDRQSIDGIQYLRGVAAMMVVLVHVPVQLARFGHEGYWPRVFAAGVDLFFVISGFIMWATTQGRGTTPMQFLRRRFIRIVPLYWALTTATLLILLAAPGLVQSGRFEAVHVLKSYLFLPAMHPVSGEIEPLLIPGWTLNYEMFFYLIFALALSLSERWRGLAVIGLLVLLASLHGVVGESSVAAAFWTRNIVLEFAFGVAIGMAYTRGLRLPWGLALILGGVGILGFAASEAQVFARAAMWGIPAACIVAAALIFERARGLPRLAWLHGLGDASYSIYLSHGMVLSALGQLWRRIAPANDFASSAAFTAVALIVVSLAGWALYSWVERPLLSSLRRRSLK